MQKSWVLGLGALRLLARSLILHEFPERGFSSHRSVIFSVFAALLHLFKNSVDSAATRRRLPDSQLMSQLGEEFDVVGHVEIEPIYNANAYSNLSIVLDTHTRVEQDHLV